MVVPLEAYRPCHRPYYVVTRFAFEELPGSVQVRVALVATRTAEVVSLAFRRFLLATDRTLPCRIRLRFHFHDYAELVGGTDEPVDEPAEGPEVVCFYLRFDRTVRTQDSR